LLHTEKPADFLRWLLDEDRSLLDNAGTGYLPDFFEATQTNNALNLKRVYRQEDSDDRVTNEAIAAGTTTQNGNPDLAQTTIMKRSENGDTLIIELKSTMKRGNQSFESSASEKWYMSDNKRSLFIKQSSFSQRGIRNITLVYDKQ
jgi:hypothetical protein